MSIQEISISIIVPVYNTKLYIRQCLESIVNQTYQTIEVIVDDDGSYDGSSEICDEFQKKDNRIKVIHTKNHGVSTARNLGIIESTGQYITFIDSDDYVDKMYIEKMVRNIEKDEEIIYFCESFPCNVKKEDAYKYIIVGDDNLKIYLAGPIAKLFNSNLLKQNEIQFNEKILVGEDLLFNIQALNYAQKIKFSNDSILYFNRNNYNSSMHSRDYRLIESDILFHNTLRRFVERN